MPDSHPAGSISGAVRDQYEAYPYPERDPESEKRLLHHTWGDYLAQINHYCFRGKNSFTAPSRILVAGGGTGDATIFLAEQLRDSGSEIVYLDFSLNSLAIARKRAEVRELRNIEWVHGSLLDLPALNLGRFDYINCSGVLHHLQDPVAGLQALQSVLAPGGAIKVMVYGTYGRTGVYLVQDLMRKINRDEAVMQKRLANAKATLASLPPGNWWTKSTALFRPAHVMGDAEIYDFFLHAQDRSYTVPEIYGWVAKTCKMHIQLSQMKAGRSPYLPETYIRDPSLLQMVKALPVPEQEAIAELMAGDMDRHSFYATNSDDTVANIDDLDNIPFFFLDFETLAGRDIAEYMDRNPGKHLQLKNASTGMTLDLHPGKYSSQLLRHLDGDRSLREIFQLARNEGPLKGAGVTDDQLREDFRTIFELFNGVEGMLLRHKDMRRIPGITKLQSTKIPDSRMKNERSGT
jgi:ubiquinone/menaquinone biosynthesis C-methylase UbiE